MALLSDYTAGTVSSSGLVITGTGTAWQTAQFREGDEFTAPGWSVKVASVDSETQLTVDPTRGVIGPALTNSEYGLRYMSDGSRASAQARQLIDMLSGTGTLEGLAGLTTAADKMPYFTGPGGAAALADLTPFARSLLDDTNAAAARATLSVRERLTANRTYYVRPDGNDANNGLANTSGGAFLTLQRAWNVVAALDLSIYSVAIQVADGTYAAGIVMSSMPVGGSSIIIEGNVENPENCHLNMTTTNFYVGAPLPCIMNIRGFRCTFAGAGASCILTDAPGRIVLSSLILSGGSTGYAGAISSSMGGAKIFVSTGITINGSMSCLFAAVGGGHIQIFGVPINIVGTPHFSWSTAIAARQGYLLASGATFLGVATGIRYSINPASVIDTEGGGPDFFPGSSAGNATPSQGGYYL